MNERRRYVPSGVEAEFEPGSRRRVLRNLLGIRTVREMNAAETRALLEAADWAVETYSVSHLFTAADLRQLHRVWLGSIYPWAGEYRGVNLAKAGFHFAAAREVARLMRELERKVLTRFTPCQLGPDTRVEEVAEALAVVHAELVLIHPFRDGNGRLARLPADAGPVRKGYRAFFGAVAGETGGLIRDFARPAREASSGAPRIEKALPIPSISDEVATAIMRLRRRFLGSLRCGEESAMVRAMARRV